MDFIFEKDRIIKFEEWALNGDQVNLTPHQIKSFLKGYRIKPNMIPSSKKAIHIYHNLLKKYFIFISPKKNQKYWNISQRKVLGFIVVKICRDNNSTIKMIV